MAPTSQPIEALDFDVLLASRPRWLSFWPCWRCPRCHRQSLKPSPLCEGCGSHRVATLTPLRYPAPTLPGLYSFEVDASQDLSPQLPSLPFNNQERVLKALNALLPKAARSQIIFDGRHPIAAGALEEQASNAGSERCFTLRHPWLQFTHQQRRLTLLDRLDIKVTKRFVDGWVKLEQSQQASFEAIIDEASQSVHVLDQDPEALLERLGDWSHRALSETLHEVPATLPRPPKTMEVLRDLRPIATSAAAAMLVMLTLFGPIKRQLEIMRLTRGLGGGPRIAAVERLIEIGQERTLSFDELLTHKDPWVRRNTLAVVAALGRPKARARLRKLSRDRSPIVHSGAVRGLEDLADKEGLRALSQDAKAPLEARLLAVRALSENHDRDFLGSALALLKSSESPLTLRAELLFALPNLAPDKDPESLALLRPLIKSEQASALERRAAVLAWHNLGGSDTLLRQSLRSLTEGLTKEPERLRDERLVLRALVRSLSVAGQARTELKELRRQDWIDPELCEFIELALTASDGE